MQLVTAMQLTSFKKKKKKKVLKNHALERDLPYKPFFLNNPTFRDCKLKRPKKS